MIKEFNAFKRIYSDARTSGQSGFVAAVVVTDQDQVIRIERGASVRWEAAPFQHEQIVPGLFEGTDGRAVDKEYLPR